MSISAVLSKAQGPYSWRDGRHCLSLVDLGAYAQGKPGLHLYTHPFVRKISLLTEGRACVLARRDYGSMEEAYRRVLLESGWKKAWRHTTKPGDAVILGAPVFACQVEVQTPRRDAIMGVKDDSHQIIIWTKMGLQVVSQANSQEYWSCR